MLRKLRKQWKDNTAEYRQKKKCTEDAERALNRNETELAPSDEPKVQVDQL